MALVPEMAVWRRKAFFFFGLTIFFLGAAPATPAEAPRPLTFANVRSYFSDTLGFRPTEVQKRCVIFYEGEWVSAKVYNYCVIIVENSDEDLQVTFYITDDQEMNWVNEFLQSPFFTRNETENLYRLLHRERHARAEQVGRFRVDLRHWEPRHAEIIVLSFTPLRAVAR
jgi:hypothetical protein